jgi:hypothetical protein
MDNGDARKDQKLTEITMESSARLMVYGDELNGAKLRRYL